MSARAPMRVIIVDDEPAALHNLRSVLDEFEGLEVIAEAGDGDSAIREITERHPDLVFLDIEMPGLNGFEVALKTAHLKHQLVFVTAYDAYALEAFRTHAIDYLLKPVRPSLLKACIEKILRQEEVVVEALQKQKTPLDTLVLSDGSDVRVLSHEHVCFIEGLGRYRRIHLNDVGAELHQTRTIVSDTTLDEFEAQLPPSRFMRLHRSYIVHLERVVELFSESRRHFVRLAGVDTKVPVSRSRVSDLKTRL